MILKSYTLEIVSDDVADVSSTADWDMQDARVLADMPARLEEIVENLTDLLPGGYRAQIGEEKP